MKMLIVSDEKWSIGTKDVLKDGRTRMRSNQTIKTNSSKDVTNILPINSVK
jgi:hypothetical protein